jgi:topoisomerase IV subunit A
MSQLRPLMESNFLEYASYVIIDRAIPELVDGCKPVQRRILHTLREMHDGRFHKVANVIGETMKLHPHGETSIGDALVVVANKDYFIERQGNFGNILTGHNAAAARYIECRLTPLAIETLFNPAITEFVPSYDGRKREPYLLPAKVPVLLMLGAEGIAVGLATRILPHNFVELLEGVVEVLRGREVQLFPDFPQGGLMDAADYQDGAGRVRVRARIEIDGPKRLVIREVPFGTTTTSLIASIEAAVQRGKVAISSIDDFTTVNVEIELTPSRGVSAEDVLPQLFAYTDCEVSVASNIVVIENKRPIEVTISQFLAAFAVHLKRVLKLELEYELGILRDREHWLTLERIFIENRIYKRIETVKTEAGISKAVRAGLEPFSRLFIRELTEDDIKKLLELRIRRISAYDLERTKGEIDDIVRQIGEAEVKLKALTRTAVAFVEGLLGRYRERYPRRTEITSFEVVDRKAVARANIRLGYDSTTGFFGSAVRGDGLSVSVSEYDRILAVTADGTYRVLAPPDKMLLPGKLLHCSIFDKEKGADLLLVYRDEARVAWGKRVHIGGFITDKTYDLARGSATGIDHLREGTRDEKLRLRFVPAKRQRLKEIEVNTRTIRPCGLTARGTRLHAKPVAAVRALAAKGSGPAPAPAATGEPDTEE